MFNHYVLSAKTEVCKGGYRVTEGEIKVGGLKGTPEGIVKDRWHLASEEGREWVRPLGSRSHGRGERQLSVCETRSRAFVQHCRVSRARPERTEEKTVAIGGSQVLSL